MKIAICDDDPQELHHIASLLERYRLEKKAGFSISVFCNAFDLIAELRSQTFDVVFLDIVMPDCDGINAAREIRLFDQNVKLVFLTASSEFAVESYALQAYFYLVKPAMQENFFPVLDKLFFDTQKHEEALLLKTADGVARHILPSHIVYVETLGKELVLHMCDGTTQAVDAPPAEYEAAILKHDEFVRVHRSFLVNLWQMKELDLQNFTTFYGDLVPVSKRLYPQVREAYMKNLFFREAE